MKLKHKLTHLNWQLLYKLLQDLFKQQPTELLLSGVLMLFRNISSGISILLILPLLQIIGVSLNSTQNNIVAHSITVFFTNLHIPLTLPYILGSFIFITSFVAIATFYEQTINSKLQQNYIHTLRYNLYTKLIQTTWQFFITQKTSQLIHNLTTQIQTINAIIINLLSLINYIILISVYTLVALCLSWKMTLIAIICGSILLSIILPLHRFTSKAGHQHLLNNQAIVQFITEQLFGLKTIKSSGYEQASIELVQKISSKLEHQNKKLTNITAATKLIYQVGAVSIFSAILWFAINQLQISSAALLLLIIIFARLLPLVSQTQQFYQRILHQLPAFNSLMELTDNCLNHQEKLQNTQKIQFQHELTLKNVCFSYATSKQPIINNFSLNIKKNSTIAIIGPSGAGKTTLIDIIMGLLTPSSGVIMIDQQKLTSHNLLNWRQSIAYVTQNAFLFHASIRDNLQIFCKTQSEQTLWSALKLAAADFVENFEQGLDTIIGDRGIRLSGGEAQRIALARALLAKPQLLILDESTNALDYDSIYKIQQALEKLRGKITLIIISHQNDMRNFADQYIELK